MIAPPTHFPIFINPQAVIVKTPALPHALLDAWFDFCRAVIRAWSYKK